MSRFGTSCRDTISEPVVITVLGWFLVGLLCVSMVFVSRIAAPVYHIEFDSRSVLPAVLSVAKLGLCLPLLAYCRSPVGFAVSLYLFANTAGYVWLSHFTPLSYDHGTARLSAAASWVAFAIPALLITKPLSIRDWLLPRQMDLLAGALILFAAAVAARAYWWGFYFVGYIEGELLRHTLDQPTWMRYAIMIFASAVLPFCYAWFATRRSYAIAALALAISLAYYPITLSKTTLLTPAWLVFITILLKITRWQIAVVLSLLIPALVGLIALVLNPLFPTPIFNVINFRMLAIPASAIDHYSHFFSTHPLTNFCQIRIVGRMFDCTLTDQFGDMMAREYAIGNYNASLIAEGVASVGPYFAPLAALICGLVIAVGNVTSTRLDPALVLLSVAALLPILMNVSLSTVALTHGGFILPVLWLLTPSVQDKRIIS